MKEAKARITINKLWQTVPKQYELEENISIAAEERDLKVNYE